MVSSRPEDEARGRLVAMLLGAEVSSLERLAGGSKKGAYRVRLNAGSTYVAYLWDSSENYWPATDEEQEPFTAASGQQLFLEAQAALASVGVRTPSIVAEAPDVVIVEDLIGGSLESLLRRDPDRAMPALGQLREMLDLMAATSSTTVGRVGSALARPDSCERIAYDRARRHFAEAQRRRPELPGELLEVLTNALARVEPRPPAHALVHGELGPDHVFLDHAGSPVLIDIEGLMHFDAEWEHAFMAFRFGPHYETLRPTGLDPARLHLYTICLRLSLIAGPLRLLDGPFPDRAGMLEIVEHNVRAAVAYLTEQQRVATTGAGRA